MRAVWILANKELHDGLRNRWVAATILLLGTMALALTFVGSAPRGTVGASAMDINAVSLASLTVYLLPLIALMLSFDALVGEFERGTMLLLLTYPVGRWQVVVGKFVGHMAILLIAIVLGYGGAAAAIAFTGDGDPEGWRAYLAMMASSLLLGGAFVALGYLLSVMVRERATAVGAAMGLWLVLVVLYDLALLGALLADEAQIIGPELLTALLLTNPTDAYRVFNLTAFDGASEVAGLAGIVAKTGTGGVWPLVAMSTWIILPLGASIALFHRREL